MRWGEVVGYTAMILAMTATFFAMRAEAARNGPLSFGRALIVGALVSLVAGVIFGLATWGFYAWWGDALPQALYEFYRAKAAGDPAKLAELETMRGFLFNRPLQAAVMAATVFMIGLIESLIGAVVVSRRPRAATASPGAQPARTP
jgi:hypothetical protein